MPNPTSITMQLYFGRDLYSRATLCGTDCTLFVCSLNALLKLSRMEHPKACHGTKQRVTGGVLCSQGWCDAVTDRRQATRLACCSAGNRLTRPLAILYHLQVHL